MGSAEWLRLYARQFEDQHAPHNLSVGLREAADEIERLKDGEARLREALREISGDNWFFIEDIKNYACAALEDK